MAEEPQIDERNGERETLLAALEAADTPPSEETPKSEELASDASESEETADTTPAETEPEVKAEEEVTGETSEPSNREKKSQERRGRSLRPRSNSILMIKLHLKSTGTWQSNTKRTARRNLLNSRSKRPKRSSNEDRVIRTVKWLNQ